ncbi:hypothetical protein E4U43_006571, partial [Claviceps pusilla]
YDDVELAGFLLNQNQDATQRVDEASALVRVTSKPSPACHGQRVLNSFGASEG